MDITTIGFALAKTVFQVHGADGEDDLIGTDRYWEP